MSMMVINPFVFTAAGVLPSLSYVTSASQGAGGPSFTFTATAIGTAGATRFVVVAVGSRIDAGTVDPTGVTIAGGAATLIVEHNNGDNYVGLWGRAVAAGTTANIVVTFDDTRDQCLIAVYAVYDLISNTASATSSDTAGTLSLNLNTQADGVLIGACFDHGTPTAGTWTGATENAEVANAGGRMCVGSASGIVAATPRTVSGTVTGGTGAQVGVCATWR